MEKETDSYRVYDERSPEVDIFAGTHDECMDYLVENYHDEDADFNHVWVQPYEEKNN